MAEPTFIDILEAWKNLLREGRPQEVDNQIVDLRTKLIAAEEAARKNRPAEAPKTEAELSLAILDEIDSLFGHRPRLHAYLVELHGLVEKKG